MERRNTSRVSKINDDDWNTAWEDEEEDRQSGGDGQEDDESMSMTESIVGHPKEKKSKKQVAFIPEITTRGSSSSGEYRSSGSSSTGDRQIIMESVEFDKYMDLKTSSFTIRLLWVAQVFSLGIFFCYTPQYWYAILMVVFSLTGLYGSFRNDYRLIGGYLIYLVLCIFVLFICLFVGMLTSALHKLPALANMVVIGLQLFVTYKTYQYYEKLPRGASFEQTYSKFVSRGNVDV
eukprot:TRINITY_DN18250_c0_g1_i1.p1 TRINITY_DN18250_c0_g1~~TRINITY_DN18250_c0_g1_i1.p1  ORF type:complete len:234 (-),score=36.32 TRINITY_DN18250_c0_g1_i1:60-761(-)